MHNTDEASGFRGYIQLYTGNGKGKTTAALGLALRAAGHGLRTYFGQFLKGKPSGEGEAVKKLSSLITIERFGREGFVFAAKGPDEEDIQLARQGLQKCREAMRSSSYHIVVLDEVNTAVHLKLLREEEILSLIREKPENVEIVLTGRNAPPSFISEADLVTEMREVKHYFAVGVAARTGIEK